MVRMRRAPLVMLLLVAASCNTLTSPGLTDDRLSGNWRGPTAYVAAYQSILYVYQANASTQTDGPISIGRATGLFQAHGFWAPRATPDQPDRTAEFRRVLISGRLLGTKGPLRLMVTDSASGGRYVDESLKWEPPPPPPPAPVTP